MKRRASMAHAGRCKQGGNQTSSAGLPAVVTSTLLPFSATSPTVPALATK